MKTLKEMDKLEKYRLYRKAAEKSRKEMDEYSATNCPDEKLFSWVYKMVKEATYCPRATDFDKEQAMFIFLRMRRIIEVIGRFTPTQLEHVFPIEKIFDGEKYGMKDYFYTKDLLNQLPQDEAIAKTTEVLGLLWDYMNKDLSKFLVRYMSAVDDLRACNGEKSVMQEFCENNGITTYTMLQDGKGKQVLMDNRTGRTKRAYEKKPSHLRVVK